MKKFLEFIDKRDDETILLWLGIAAVGTCKALGIM